MGLIQNLEEKIQKHELVNYHELFKERTRVKYIIKTGLGKLTIDYLSKEPE